MSIVPGRRHVSTADRQYTGSETQTTERSYRLTSCAR